MADEISTIDDLRTAVQTAISKLPPDIRVSVGHLPLSDKEIVIRVACEPMPGDRCETHLSEIKIRWWNTRREELEAYIRESPGMGFEEVLQHDADGPTIDLPSICIMGKSMDGDNTLVVGRAKIAMLVGGIQVAILNELFAGGGSSMVFTDHKGRFVRKNGTYLLDWQRP